MRLRPARLLTFALDLLYPPRCVGDGCGEIGAFICDPCLAGASMADGRRCERCWEPNEAGPCRSCEAHQPAFRELRSPFEYTGTARKAVHTLKFDGVTAIAPLLGGLMADALTAWSPPVDAIVPVPLSRWRQRTRGFNQAHLLAREVASKAGLPIAKDALSRRRHTRPQTEQLDAEARRLNVRDVFGDGRRPLTGNVLLIDDVATTGATLDACARVLLSSGASRVYGLTFARAIAAFR